MAEPTFLGIGARKCATTSLYEYFLHHPSVHVPKIKELHWFDRHRDVVSQEEYEKNFVSELACRGELTPEYQLELEGIASLYPSIKLLFMVRNPVERFISDARHKQNMHNEVRRIRLPEGTPNPFANFQPITVDVDAMLNGEGGTMTGDMLPLGKYMDTVLEADRLGLSMLVISQERMAADPSSVFKEVCAYLGVDYWEPQRAYRSNNSDHRPAFHLTENQRSGLIEYYSESNAFMKERFGIELSFPTV